MRVIGPEKLESILGRLGHNPRVVASGNFATPHFLLHEVDKHLPDLPPSHAQCPSRVFPIAQV